MVVSVTKKVDWEMPLFVNTDIEWSESGIELKTVHITEEQKLKQLISFFEILDTKNVSEGVITQLWEFGYQSIEHILSLVKEDFEEIPGFGKKKAKIVYDSIQKSIKDIELCKLQHASNMFSGLGSKKLVLLEHFKTKPTIFDVM
jgi:NAD-dependent DNA ligase